MTRSNARELAVHLIYSRSFTGEEPETALESRLDQAYYAALSQENEVYAERPSRKQLAYLDQVVVGTAILQLALFECQWVEDVPVGVAVNEAVTLAKKYDGDDAGTFVNGILRAFLRNREQPEPVEAPPEAPQEAPAP